MWPNLALNRTLCGSPGLGSKSLAQTRPAAKCRLASTLGPTQMLQDQCRRATTNMISGEKQFKFEPAVPYSCNAVAAASFAAAKSLGSHYSPHPGRGLTWRSTGPIAAGRHLGYKSLAQIPAGRNRPVSLYVRPHPNASRSIPQSYGKCTFLVKSNSSSNQTRHTFAMRSQQQVSRQPGRLPAAIHLNRGAA